MTASNPAAGGVVDVVGIGADGWEGLAPASREVIARAEVVFGSLRQLAHLPSELTADRVSWPSPLLPALDEVLGEHAQRARVVLASGDPMFYGIGSTLARRYGPASIRVWSHPSSVSLACARLGWPLHECVVISVVARPVEALAAALFDGARVLVLSETDRTVTSVAELLRSNGFGGSRVTVLSQLGGPDESILSSSADDWTRSTDTVDPLNVVAIDCRRDTDRPALSLVPGLADEMYSGDGQMTKNEVRALTVSALAPAPGDVLWDVGSGSGTIAIEWMRTDPACRAVAFERSPERSQTITNNASALGVPGLTVRGRAPLAFGDLPAPDAVFVGGGVTEDGVLDSSWDRLRPGGRIVVNAVTAESEALILQWFAARGGRLRKFQIYRGESLGSFTAWRPHLPVAQWVCAKPHASETPR